MKKISVLLLLCFMLTACSTSDTAMTDDSAGSLVVSSKQTIASDNSTDNVGTDASVASAVPGMEDVPTIDTWRQYECAVGDIILTFKLPDFLLFDDAGEPPYIYCDNSSPFYQYFPGRYDSVAGFRIVTDKYIKVSDTEYDVPEVGQYFRYTYATDLQPLTFFEYESYIVFVSGPQYFNPTSIYSPEHGFEMWFYFVGAPEIPIEIFKMVVSTVAVL